MTKYTFKTIVAPADVRADFTILRDRHNSSDKELMQAMWNLAMRNIEALDYEVTLSRHRIYCNWRITTNQGGLL